MTSPVAGWDFTISKEKFPDLNVLQKTLTEWFKHWVFQGEEGEGGYQHWQGRGSLIKKKRKSEIVAQCNGFFPGVHWSPTSTEVHAGQNFNYVLKADTRTDGPYSDKDYEEPPPLTRQLKGFMEQELRPWQEKVMEIMTSYNERSITLILDQVGNSGKSIFAEYMEYKKLGYEVPPMRLMEDIMQCAMGIKAQRCYMIDMPRAMKKDKLGDFYAGLEALKNGVMYDKRYSFKKRRIDRPQIIVFTNTLPDWELMSKDRWEVYEITKDYDLVKYDTGLHIT